MYTVVSKLKLSVAYTGQVLPEEMTNKIFPCTLFTRKKKIRELFTEQKSKIHHLSQSNCVPRVLDHKGFPW